jgi:hypothetical protein
MNLRRVGGPLGSLFLKPGNYSLGGQVCKRQRHQWCHRAGHSHSLAPLLRLAADEAHTFSDSDVLRGAQLLVLQRQRVREPRCNKLTGKFLDQELPLEYDQYGVGILIWKVIRNRPTRLSLCSSCRSDDRISLRCTGQGRDGKNPPSLQTLLLPCPGMSMASTCG